MELSMWLRVFFFVLAATHFSSGGLARWKSLCHRPTIRNGHALPWRTGGHRIRYNCNKGYRRLPFVQNVCVRGRWVMAHPVCVRAGCAALAAPAGGTVRRRLHGAVASFSCDRGLHLSSPGTLYCDGRRWNGTVPRCLDAATPRTTSPPGLTDTTPAVGDSRVACGFESADLCGWTVLRGLGRLQWSRQLQPADGHDGLKLPSSGYHMRLRAERAEPGGTARLMSTKLPAPASESACFRYWSRQPRHSADHVRVYVRKWPLQLHAMAGHATRGRTRRHRRWTEMVVPLPRLRTPFRIVIEGAHEAGHGTDIAVDDVALMHGDACSPEAVQPGPGRPHGNRTQKASIDWRRKITRNGTIMTQHWPRARGVTRTVTTVLPFTVQTSGRTLDTDREFVAARIATVTGPPAFVPTPERVVTSTATARSPQHMPNASAGATDAFQEETLVTLGPRITSFSRAPVHPGVGKFTTPEFKTDSATSSAAIDSTLHNIHVPKTGRTRTTARTRFASTQFPVRGVPAVAGTTRVTLRVEKTAVTDASSRRSTATRLEPLGAKGEAPSLVPQEAGATRSRAPASRQEQGTTTGAVWPVRKVTKSAAEPRVGLVNTSTRPAGVTTSSIRQDSVTIPGVTGVVSTQMSPTTEEQPAPFIPDRARASSGAGQTTEVPKVPDRRTVASKVPNGSTGTQKAENGRTGTPKMDNARTVTLKIANGRAATPDAPGERVAFADASEEKAPGVRSDGRQPPAWKQSSAGVPVYAVVAAVVTVALAVAALAGVVVHRRRLGKRRRPTAGDCVPPIFDPALDGVDPISTLIRQNLLDKVAVPCVPVGGDDLTRPSES